MRSYPRTRRAARWLLTTLSLSVAGATIGSYWYGLTLSYSNPKDAVTASLKIDHAVLRWSRYWGGNRIARRDCELVRIHAADPRPAWTWRFYDPGPAGRHLFLPL